ncbi:hypothetical protein [Nannocystis pusilla]|uniref:hypothetical protein n=1 Tax=Nannocystis pusilla TaxID=889268 RepID=UPI003BF2099F
MVTRKIGMFVWFGVVLGGCGDDGGRTSDGGSATQATTTTTSPTTTTTGGATDEPTTTAPTGTAGETMTGTSDATSTTDVATDTSTTTGPGVNQPPTWESEPGTEIVIEELFKSNFAPGQIFLASSRTDEIRVYDGNSLAFIQAFTHPVFSEVDSPLYTYGPNGASFNSRGNLVVAGYSSFVEFSDYGVEYAVYPKIASEATENVIFDPRGNLYTTTATGGTDKLNQYDAMDYAFAQQIPLPAGAGQLTGITFDGQGRLYLASQTDNTIHVADFDDFAQFPWIATLSGAGNPGNFEGLQFNANGELVAAAGDLVRYDVGTGMKLGTFDQPNDAFPVPLRVDNEGNIYTADYENGQGTAPADIFKFAPDGQPLTSANDPGLFGPFGLAISGTVLAGDPPVAWFYQLVATDPDGDALTYALVSGPPDMLLDPVSNVLSWSVTSEDIGEHPVVLSVDDGHGGVTEQMFTLVVVSA